FATELLTRGLEFQKKVPGSLDTWAKLKDDQLNKRLVSLAEQRRKLLDLKTDLELKGKTLSPEDAQRLQDAEFEGDVGGLEKDLRRFEAKPLEKLHHGEMRTPE